MSGASFSRDKHEATPNLDLLNDDDHDHDDLPSRLQVKQHLVVIEIIRLSGIVPLTLDLPEASRIHRTRVSRLRTLKT